MPQDISDSSNIQEFKITLNNEHKTNSFTFNYTNSKNIIPCVAKLAGKSNADYFTGKVSFRINHNNDKYTISNVFIKDITHAGKLDVPNENSTDGYYYENYYEKSEESTSHSSESTKTDDVFEQKIYTSVKQMFNSASIKNNNNKITISMTIDSTINEVIVLYKIGSIKFNTDSSNEFSLSSFIKKSSESSSANVSESSSSSITNISKNNKHINKKKLLFKNIIKIIILSIVISFFVFLVKTKFFASRAKTIFFLNNYKEKIVDSITKLINPKKSKELKN
jgi:hypothetical protein